MRHTLKTLTLVFVRSFYLKNASLFLLVAGLGGGFMSEKEHRALAEFFVSSPLTTLIPICLWTMYAMKVIAFNAGETMQRENEFILNTILLRPAERIVSIAIISLCELLPAVLYGSFLAATSWRNNLLPSAACLIIAMSVLLTSVGAALSVKLLNPNPEKRTTFLTRLLNRALTRPYPVFVIEWLMRKNTLLLIAIKAFASAILYAVLNLYNSDSYDARLLGLGIVVIASANAQLVFEIHRFENSHFRILRQLPFSISARLFKLIVVITILICPELSVLMSKFPVSLPVSVLVSAVTMFYGYLLFIYAALYLKNQNQDQQMKFILTVALTSIFLVLCAIPLWVLAVTTILLAIALIRFYYFEYEPSEKIS